MAASNLMATMMKVHGDKHPSELNDASNRWQAQYRTKEWLFGVIDSLGGPPEYVAGAVAVRVFFFRFMLFFYRFMLC